MEETNNIHKFTVYTYGINDRMMSTAKEVEEELSSSRDLIIHSFHEGTVVVKDIYDDHPLNMTDCSQETWEKYMDPELNKLFQEKLEAERKFENYKKEKGISDSK